MGQSQAGRDRDNWRGCSRKIDINQHCGRGRSPFNVSNRELVVHAAVDAAEVEDEVKIAEYERLKDESRRRVGVEGGFAPIRRTSVISHKAFVV